MRKSYMRVTKEAGAKYFGAPSKGRIVMLNMLKYKVIADYSESPELALPEKISGKDAYTRYMKAVVPILEKAGGRMLFIGKASEYLIGPSEEDWDLILLVEHKDKDTFLSFAQDPEYRAIAGHRTAALADSRLLPVDQLK